MTKNIVSRRDFLRLSALGAGSAVIAACAPVATQAPTAVPPTAAPTKLASTAVPPTTAPTPSGAGTPTGAGSPSPTAAATKAPTIAPTTPVVATPTASSAVIGSGTVKIKIWQWGGINTNVNNDKALLELYPDLGKKITIERASMGGTDAEVYQALRLALAAGKNIPDIVQMNYIAVPEFTLAGVLTDLSAMMKPYEAELTAAGKVLTLCDGKTVAVPRQIKTKLWFYRKDLFAKASIDPAHIKTFEDFVEAGKKYNKANPDSYIINLGPQPIHYMYFMMLSHWPDVRVADKDGKYLITKDERFATVLNWLKTMYSSGITLKTDDYSPDWNQVFASNKVGSWLGSSWGYSNPPTWTPDGKGKWGVALWPEFNRWGAESGGAVTVIPKAAAQPEAAFEYLAKQQLTKDGALQYFNRMNTPPASKSALTEIAKMAEKPEKPASMTDDQWKTALLNFYGKDLVDSYNASSDVYRIFAYDPASSAELTILRQHTEAFLAGKETLQEALSKAQTDMEKQIGNPYKL